MRTTFFLLALSTLILAGCTDWKAKVESNTRWSGSFSGRTVDGNGNKTIDLDDDDVQCCVVQKETEQGFLKVSIVNEGSNPFASDGESKETTAAYGVVSVCNK